MSQSEAVFNEVLIDHIAYETALNHVCPNNRVPTTPYEAATIATLRRLIKHGILRALAETQGST